MSPRIHFASLFCIDYDMDLFPFWSAHYRNFHYDSYTVFLHTNHELTNEACRRYMDQFEAAGFNASWVFGPFKDGDLRERMIGHFQQKLSPADYFVTADSDEFHEVTDADEFRALMLSHDMIEGYLVDAWGERLVDADLSRPLKEQYPHEGNVKEAGGIEGQIHPNRRKILACRAGIPINHIGAHCPNERFKQFTFPRRFRVLHYTFRSSFLWRMYGKNYFRSQDMLSMMRYFHEPQTNPAFVALLEKEDEIMQAQGWIPAASRTVKKVVTNG